MIYDCFTFNNELDLLELRLQELSSVVDKHVLVESSSTFTGIAKPLHFKKNQRRFARYLNKIIHVVVNDMENAIPATSFPYFSPKSFQINHIPAWSREIHQRNAIMRGLTDAKKTDIILISDVDEIPRAKIIKSLRVDGNVIGLELDNYNYFLNCRSDDNWVGTKALTFSALSKSDPEEIRESIANKIIPNAGWHFSFIGGHGAVKDKIAAFSHQEHNNQTNKESTFLKFNLENALDIFSRPFHYRFVNIDQTFPQYLQKNKKKFKKYMMSSVKVDANTSALREEVFKVRSVLYWKELELKEVQTALNHYQELYRSSVKSNPIPYILGKIKQKLAR